MKRLWNWFQSFFRRRRTRIYFGGIVCDFRTGQVIREPREIMP